MCSTDDTSFIFSVNLLEVIIIIPLGKCVVWLPLGHLWDTQEDFTVASQQRPHVHWKCSAECVTVDWRAVIYTRCLCWLILPLSKSAKQDPYYNLDRRNTQVKPTPFSRNNLETGWTRQGSILFKEKGSLFSFHSKWLRKDGFTTSEQLSIGKVSCVFWSN